MPPNADYEKWNDRDMDKLGWIRIKVWRSNWANFFSSLIFILQLSRESWQTDTRENDILVSLWSFHRTYILLGVYNGTRSMSSLWWCLTRCFLGGTIWFVRVILVIRINTRHTHTLAYLLITGTWLCDEDCHCPFVILKIVTRIEWNWSPRKYSQTT